MFYLKCITVIHQRQNIQSSHIFPLHNWNFRNGPFLVGKYCLRSMNNLWSFKHIKEATWFTSFFKGIKVSCSEIFKILIFTGLVNKFPQGSFSKVHLKKEHTIHLWTWKKIYLLRASLVSHSENFMMMRMFFLFILFFVVEMHTLKCGKSVLCYSEVKDDNCFNINANLIYSV